MLWCSKRQAASSDAERLQAEAKEAEKARAGADHSVEELLEKLRLVGETLLSLLHATAWTPGLVPCRT